MSRVDTASGLGGGQLTENPAKPSPEGGSQPPTNEPLPSSGSLHEPQDDTIHESGKSEKGRTKPD
ncbi:hypothetical protein [Rubellimicrobium aerolatum]|uniref:Uncharacterized protein n=1 Tax=Rubellimicrobium aerolatum TaxID=490979 RepID=A0ABW0SF76_9RHOB|nr:hypothetical protein [Rubellimicrobium aerolatum]MBP1806523.1 hypothetical protein [Rubellimicrobium aerolatum]